LGKNRDRPPARLIGYHPATIGDRSRESGAFSAMGAHVRPPRSSQRLSESGGGAARG
jgi:hypothetical protein